MLNEIGEFEQYTMLPQDISDCKYRRLKYFTLIKGDFSGLERALTIVARKFIFNDGNLKNLDEDKIKEIKEILKAWCGFDNEKKSSLPPHFQGWLVNYICYAFLSQNVQDCLEKISLLEKNNFQKDYEEVLKEIPLKYSDESFEKSLQDFENLNATYGKELKKIGNEPTQIFLALKKLVKLSNKNKNYSKSLFGGLTVQGDIPFRAITYDRIIANAILAGKLCRYYLCCDEDLFDANKILKDARTLRIGDEDMILKMTASYLLQRRNNSQEFIETNDSNIMNWLKSIRKPENFDRESYTLAESGENIFEVNKVWLGKIPVLKVKINPEWTKHFWLVEENENTSDLGEIFFSDSGSCAPLRKGVRYV
ncbi:MAG: hypothetical protein IK062_01010 [Selenomonadaceae bacterium]|nr:hypothetical protein [Selenomonadaceae bacterium]